MKFYQNFFLLWVLFSWRSIAQTDFKIRITWYRMWSVRWLQTVLPGGSVAICWYSQCPRLHRVHSIPAQRGPGLWGNTGESSNTPPVYMIGGLKIILYCSCSNYTQRMQNCKLLTLWGNTGESSNTPPVYIIGGCSNHTQRMQNCTGDKVTGKERDGCWAQGYLISDQRSEHVCNS